MFCWVPRHVRISDNEQAVTQACSTIMSTPHQCCFPRIPTTAHYPHFKTFLYAQCQSFWSSLLTNILHTVKLSISSCQLYFIRTSAGRWHLPACMLATLALHTSISFHGLICPYVPNVMFPFQFYTFHCSVHTILQPIPLLPLMYPLFTDLQTS